MYFTITTNREVANQIELQCKYDERTGNRSYKLGDIRHEPGHSVVQIVSKNETIEYSDIFWLAHYSGQFTI